MLTKPKNEEYQANKHIADSSFMQKRARKVKNENENSALNWIPKTNIAREFPTGVWLLMVAKWNFCLFCCSCV